MVQPLWKRIWPFPPKLNTKLPYDPTPPLPGVYPKELKAADSNRNLNTNTHSSIIQNTQKVETNQKGHCQNTG